MAKKNRRSSSKIMEKHPGGSRSIKTKTRKRTATIVQKKKGPQGGSTRYRFPMPDKSHARSALAMLPKAKGLSAADRKKIKTYHIDKKQMWGMGTPEDLNRYINDFNLT